MFRANPDFRDDEEGFDFLAVFAEAIADISGDFLQGFDRIGEGQPSVKIDPEAGFAEIIGGNPGLDGRKLTGRVFLILEHGVTVLVTSALGSGFAGPFTHKGEIEFDGGADGRGLFFAFESGDGLPEQLTIEFETNPYDMATLLGTEKIAGSTEFEIAHGDAETSPELIVLPHGS